MEGKLLIRDETGKNDILLQPHSLDFLPIMGEGGACPDHHELCPGEPVFHAREVFDQESDILLRRNPAHGENDLGVLDGVPLPDTIAVQVWPKRFHVDAAGNYSGPPHPRGDLT